MTETRDETHCEGDVLGKPNHSKTLRKNPNELRLKSNRFIIKAPWKIVISIKTCWHKKDKGWIIETFGWTVWWITGGGRWREGSAQHWVVIGELTSTVSRRIWSTSAPTATARHSLASLMTHKKSSRKNINVTRHQLLTNKQEHQSRIASPYTYMYIRCTCTHKWITVLGDFNFGFQLTPDIYSFMHIFKATKIG